MYHHRVIRHVTNHILPTEHNGFIPHILKDGAIWAMLGVSVALFGFSQFFHLTNYANLAAEVYPTVIVTLTNSDRKENGLGTLSVNPTLQAAAQLKLNDMIKYGYFAHTSPSGITPWHWFEAAGYNFVYAGENLAINFDESEDVQRAWLNSPTHRANVLSPNFTEIGIATAEGMRNGHKTTFVVEMFGTPAIPKIIAPVVEPPKNEPEVEQKPEPVVAGESTRILQPKAPDVVIMKETPQFVAAKNADTTLEEKATIPIPAPTVPWYERLLLKSDRYIAIALQTALVALLIALAGLGVREYEKHHFKHLAYGMLMTVILTSFLFVGRIGVFAQQNPSFNTTVLQQ